mmetsp:Transcript_56805/g.128743  ORF Transcript_56805/g.128743 Transcript_56805/m.128743 type:complete len:219 (-) Transcript_56805:912-1568(-)
MTAMPASPMALRRTCSACPHTPRISSKALSSADFLSSGRSLGTKGSTSCGLCTSLHMLMITVAALRFSCIAPRDVILLWRTGTMTLSEAASTAWMKVVCIRSSSACGVSSGFRIAAIIDGITGSMSGLPMTRHASDSADLAAFATSFLVSRRQVVTRGTMSGMQMLSWEEACLARTPTSWHAPCLTRQSGCSIASKSTGNTSRAALGLMLCRVAAEAP